MGHFHQPQSESHAVASKATLAKPLAPEDIQVGDFVTMLHTITEVPSFLWCADAATLPFDELVRIRYIPEPAGVPLKVKSICLPFVLVKRPFGDRHTLDVRQCRLARIDAEFATAAWKTHKRRRSKKKRKSRRKP